MTTLIRWLCCIPILLLLTTASISAEEKPLSFEEDGRAWVFQGQTKLGERSYVPDGQNSNDWNEIIILNHLDVKEVPLDVYYQKFTSLLSQKSGNSFHTKIVEMDENHMIFEWWVDPKAARAEHGWIRVTKTPQGLQFFRYTTRNVEDIDSIRAKWEAILRKYSFTSTPTNIHVRIHFDKDPRRWVPADGDSYTYYPEGESTGEWTEEFRVIPTQGANISLWDAYFQAINNIEKATKKEVHSKVISSNSSSIFFNVKAGRSDYLIKIQTYPADVMVSMVYTAKSRSNNLKLWEEILKESTVDIQYSYVKHENANQ